MREILTGLAAVLDKGLHCVFCAVIETRGSTPQKAGAAMLVFPDGTQLGTLGGGCVEAEVRQRALRSIDEDKPEIHTFCLDDDYGWDDGLICGGRMTILADPVAPHRPEMLDYYRQYRQLVEAGQGCTESVVVADHLPARKRGQRFLFDQNGLPVAWLRSDGIPDEVARLVVPLSTRPAPSLREGIAFLPTLPRITILLIGGGHVSQAVARLASGVDFNVWVLDDRERYVSLERFPTAERRIVGDIEETLPNLALSLTPSFYCLIVTRGHAHDEEALYHLAPSQAGYVGMIGSRRKIKIIYEDLIAKGITREALERVHAPLGFNIGSQTVPEIAISIVAELIACRNLGHTIREV
jgi:xanthine dehydrogenase accessory factor